MGCSVSCYYRREQWWEVKCKRSECYSCEECEKYGHHPKQAEKKDTHDQHKLAEKKDTHDHLKQPGKKDTKEPSVKSKEIVQISTSTAKPTPRTGQTTHHGVTPNMMSSITSTQLLVLLCVMFVIQCTSFVVLIFYDRTKHNIYRIYRYNIRILYYIFYSPY